MITDNLKGLGVALVTPFDRDDRIDYEALERILQHMNSGADYLVVFGTTGESVTVSADEKAQALQFIKALWKKPIVLGYGGNHTAALIDGIKHIAWDGISAVLSVSPYYNRPSQTGIIKHYSLLADHLPIPLILYNVPGRTGSKLTADTTLKLSEHHNIIGTKEASGDLEQIREITEKSDEFLVISGDDLLTPEILGLGGHGLISVLANAYPAEFNKAIQLFLKGNENESRSLFRKFDELNTLMYAEGSPTGIKELMHQKGLCLNNVRLPMDQASKSLSQKISKHLF